MGLIDLIADLYSALSFTEVHAEAPEVEEKEAEGGESNSGEEKEEGGENEGEEEEEKEGGDDEGGDEEEEEEEEEEEPEDPKPKLEEEHPIAVTGCEWNTFIADASALPSSDNEFKTLLRHAWR
ncbi:hypothetical protein MMC34_002525 [Xylographa carneopallida]|nr:hypothetical protein [Xylographa carneopallida]